MELKKIRYFLRIVETGSLTRAAASLYLTQPTLSRFLARLEEEAGMKLFHRTPEGVLRLTQAGECYRAAACRIDALWTQLEKDLDRMNTGGKQQLRLGIDGDCLQPFAAACAEAVMERFPEVSVSVFCAGSHEIQNNIAQGLLDIGMTAFSQQDPRLSCLQCTSSEMQLVVSRSHPLAVHACPPDGQKPDRLSLHSLPAGTAFALMQRPSVLRNTADAYMEKQRFSPLIHQTYMRHGSIVRVLTGKEPLVGFCPENNRSEKLAYIPLDPPFFYTRGIFCRKSSPLSAPEKMLVDLLREHSGLRILDE